MHKSSTRLLLLERLLDHRQALVMPRIDRPETSHSASPPRHNRSPTWPASGQLLSSSPSQSPPKTSSPPKSYDLDADEDPFSHFLSPILDDEGPFAESWSYSAGITDYVPESASKKAAKFRSALGHRWNSFVTRQHSALSSPPSEHSLPDLLDEGEDVATPEGSPASDVHDSFADDGCSVDEWLDGWEADRLRAQAKQRDRNARFQQPSRPALKRPRGKSSRTLSGKKHSWREPSEELWTVPEEGVMMAPQRSFSGSTISELSICEKRVVKRVRFALGGEEDEDQDNAAEEEEEEDGFAYQEAW